MSTPRTNPAAEPPPSRDPTPAPEAVRYRTWCGVAPKGGDLVGYVLFGVVWACVTAATGHPLWISLVGGVLLGGGTALWPAFIVRRGIRIAIDADGLTVWWQATRSSVRATIPIDEIDGFEVRRWYGTRRTFFLYQLRLARPRHCMSVRTTDGRRVKLPGLERPGRRGHSARVLVRPAGELRWRTMRGPGGGRFAWSAATDDILVAELERQLAAVTGTGARLRNKGVALQKLLGNNWTIPLGPFTDLRGAAGPDGKARSRSQLSELAD